MFYELVEGDRLLRKIALLSLKRLILATAKTKAAPHSIR
ncbi:hypothetical protein I33_3607 [Bacillus subtilis subsp. subtilis str. RO-NN-1]|nr:hypothetical protein I33_3607 [Bacillus subtilis subsp. subtilis str. RO-NN-1]